MIKIDSIRRSYLWPFNRVAQVTCQEREATTFTNYFGTSFHYMDAGDRLKVTIKNEFAYKAGDRIALIDLCPQNRDKFRVSNENPCEGNGSPEIKR